ncbi:hypothetical protein PVAND_011877 [Polypedilum vanderplanki]|uniref:Uncharacterized protein n=1 Tax=Polypedilum vanderplanki TaxID=319348 RepID=A0A9J6CJY3_POLVA|nr:hypothetical protein PVAND_011877 [Polypedilum vanderplanki]
MKKFVACNASKKRWKVNSSKDDEHLIIYSKDIKTVFQAWQEINSNVQRLTINIFTEDPVLSINPYFVSNLEVKMNIKEINFNCYTHDYWLTLILSLCPNIEKLYFFKLTKEKLKYIAEHLDYVKNIECDFIESDTIEFYNDMRKQRKDINTDIKIN